MTAIIPEIDFDTLPITPHGNMDACDRLGGLPLYAKTDTGAHEGAISTGHLGLGSGAGNRTDSK
jgi:hypothetical protein